MTEVEMSYAERAAALVEAGLSWEPEPGESIAGSVVSIDRDAGRDKDSIVFELEECDTGRIVSIWCSKMLENIFNKRKVQLGDIVGVKFFEKIHLENGNDFNKYAMEVFKRVDNGFDDDIPF